MLLAEAELARKEEEAWRYEDENREARGVEKLCWRRKRRGRGDDDGRNRNSKERRRKRRKRIKGKVMIDKIGRKKEDSRIGRG